MSRIFSLDDIHGFSGLDKLPPAVRGAAGMGEWIARSGSVGVDLDVWPSAHAGRCLMTYDDGLAMVLEVSQQFPIGSAIRSEIVVQYRTAHDHVLAEIARAERQVAEFVAAPIRGRKPRVTVLAAAEGARGILTVERAHEIAADCVAEAVAHRGR